MLGQFVKKNSTQKKFNFPCENPKPLFQLFFGSEKNVVLREPATQHNRIGVYDRHNGDEKRIQTIKNRTQCLGTAGKSDWNREFDANQIEKNSNVKKYQHANQLPLGVKTNAENDFQVDFGPFVGKNAKKNDVAKKYQKSVFWKTKPREDSTTLDPGTKKMAVRGVSHRLQCVSGRFRASHAIWSA